MTKSRAYNSSLFKRRVAGGLLLCEASAKHGLFSNGNLQKTVQAITITVIDEWDLRNKKERWRQSGVFGAFCRRPSGSTLDSCLKVRGCPIGADSVDACRFIGVDAGWKRLEKRKTMGVQGKLPGFGQHIRAGLRQADRLGALQVRIRRRDDQPPDAI